MPARTILSSLTVGLAEVSAKLGLSAALPEREGPHPAVNIQLYLAEAVLPVMPIDKGRKAEAPPEGHKSHKNYLTVKREIYRALRRMDPIDPDDMDSRVLDFVKEMMPSDDLTALNAASTGVGEITVPCSRYFDVVQRKLFEAANINDVRGWVFEYPLATVQRVFHLLFEETRGFTLRTLRNTTEPDTDLVKWHTWAGPGTDGNLHTKMVVMIQVPWIASHSDVGAFVSCDAFPPHEIRGARNRPYKSQERIWAKLWDTCRREDCHWFVYTTYEEWVFGCFSPAWSAAQVSSIKTAKAQSPTILQSLVYWFGSSMGMTSYSGVTEVPEFVEDFARAQQAIPPVNPNLTLPLPPPSESIWTARSSARDDASIAAPSDSTWTRFDVSENGLSRPALLPLPRRHVDRADDLRKRVMSWKETHGGQLAPPRSVAEDTESTETSTGTITGPQAAAPYHPQPQADFVTGRPW